MHKPRRRLLQATLGLAAAVPGLKIWPQTIAGWLPLKPTLSIGRAVLETQWQPRYFEARFERRPGLEGVLDGMIVRVGAGADAVKAFCTLCPHEICTVRLERNEEGTAPRFVCPCHQSAFDPSNDGALINGPAIRGLYRFALSQNDETIDIVSVERDALALFTGR